MKTNFIFRLFFLCGIFLCARMDAQTNNGQFSMHALDSTNVFSLKKEDFRDETGTEYAYYIERLRRGDIIPEILPANQDTNGNWGIPTNGLQLSLRFHRTKYALGETIPVIVTFRNLKSYAQRLVLTNTFALYFSFNVNCGTNTLSERSELLKKSKITDFESIPLPPKGRTSITLEAKSEMVVVLNLNRIFDLNHIGEYQINAHCQIFSPVTKSLSFEVLSGNTSFQIR